MKKISALYICCIFAYATYTPTLHAKNYSNVCVQRCLKAPHIQACGNVTVKGTIYGTAHQGAAGPQGPQGIQGLQGPLQYGNTVLVDKIYGNDTTGAREGNPFLTITAALAAAQPGDTVWVFPGTYNESFTIPAQVSVIGLSNKSTIIEQTVSANTDLVTMGELSSLQNVTLNLNSTAHVQLRGVVFPGTTTETAFIADTFIIVDNSTAGAVGTSNVYGIHSIGAGLPPENITTINNTSITVNSAGTGTKRGVLVNTVSGINIKDSAIVVTNAGGAGTFIGAETNSANSFINIRTSSSTAPTADISQTLGTITLLSTTLGGSGANGLGFSTKNSPVILDWSNPGALPAFVVGETLWMRPGSSTAAANSVAPTASIEVKVPTIVRQVSVRASVAPGGVLTNTYVLTKNGVATPLTVTLTGAQLNNSNSSASVAFAPGDLISARIIRTATTATNNPVFTMSLY